MRQTLLGLPGEVARRLFRAITGAGVEPPPAPGPADPMDLRAPVVPSGAEVGCGPGDPPEEDTAPPARAARDPDRPVIVTAARTPNPNAMKFTANIVLVDRGPLHFSSAEEAADHPMGRALFATGLVRSVYAVRDFISVSKLPEADWDTLIPLVKAAIIDES